MTLELAVMSSLASAGTVTLMMVLGLPVSTSQALAGVVLAVGIVKDINTISRPTLVNILLAWFLTPVVACFLTLVIDFVTHLHYVPSP